LTLSQQRQEEGIPKMDVFAWVDDQRERNSRAFYQLLEQGRATWTPRYIFNRCCVKWLVDGNVEYGEYYDEYSPRNGCNGGCNRDHPCITLQFDANAKSTIATLSHPLDPFVRCLDCLVAQEKAWPLSATEYCLDGYLRANETFLCSQNGFGSHLIKVAREEREASDAAQVAALEEEEQSRRPTKRPRRNESEGEGSSVLDAGDFAKAMDVALKQRLQIDLQDDPLTLFCMRRVCKSFKKIATLIASAKVKMLDLTVTPLVNGRQRYGESKVNGYDTETFDDDGFGGPDGPEYAAEYVKRDTVALAFHESSDAGKGGYQPVNTADAATFAWDSGKLDCNANEDAYEAEAAYCGQMLRIYFHPSHADPIQAPSRENMYGEAKPSLGFLVAQFNLHQPSKGSCVNVSNLHGSVGIRYEVMECNTLETEDVEEEEEEVVEYETDEEAEDGYYHPVATKGVECRKKHIQFSGSIKILEVQIDFGVLVRLHARKVASELQLKISTILQERPLTRTEKEYLQVVAAAAK